MRDITRKSCIRRFSSTNRSRLTHTFGFNAKFLTNKITKIVDDFLKFQSLSESSIRHT